MKWQGGWMTLPPVNSKTFAKIYHCRSRAKISNQCHNYVFLQSFVWWNKFYASNWLQLLFIGFILKKKRCKKILLGIRSFFHGPHIVIGKILVAGSRLSWLKYYSRMNTLLCRTFKDFQTVYEGEFWCLCTVTFEQSM